MVNRLSPLVRGLALGTVLLGSSCAQQAQEAPTPVAETPVGPSLTGLVRPAAAVFGILLADNTTHQNIASTAPDGQGAYQFGTVPAGTYTLYFNHKRGYVRPRELSVMVTAGKTTVVPAVAVVQSTASLMANGIALAPTLVDLSLNFDGKTRMPLRLFSLVLSNDDSGRPATYYLFLTMPYAVSVGTYSLNDASTYAIFVEPTTGVFDSRLNPPTVPSGGTLTITEVVNASPFPRSVSGTFSFTGTAPTLGTQKTFSGTFENAYF